MLIQDDLGGPDKVSLDEAKKVKEESAKYGVAMFPSAGENSGGIEGATPARHSRLASEAKRDDTSGGIEADSKVKSPTISATSKPKRALKLPARGSRSKASEASKGTAPILASTSSSSTLRRSDGREPTDSLSPPTSLDDDNKDDDKGKEGGWQSNMWDDSVEPPSSSLVDGEMDLEA